MDPCKNEEIQVIDFTLLKKCIQANFPKGEAGRLTKEEGLPYHEIKEIRIEYRKILRIDHLWVMKSLTKLSLNNNYIEKIENLDSLIHLTDLNLSFNNIKKIENLDSLVNLEVFTLFENKITKIENMDNNKKLLVFSIGNNLITDKYNVAYLRWFNKLTSLNMHGNPCAEDEDFRTFLVTFLPQILYYEYVLVKKPERDIGLEKYAAELRHVEQSEVELREKEDEDKKEELEMEVNKESFVEFLSGRYFFDSLFDEDSDGNALLLLGDEMKDFYAEFEEQIIVQCNEIFRIGQEQYLVRKKEIDEFKQCVEDAKLKNQQESIEYMEQFMNSKNTEILNVVQKLQRQVERSEITIAKYEELAGELIKKFDNLIHTNWKSLMEIEMNLYVQIEDCNQTFERSMNEMINTFIESAQAIFTIIRSLESVYVENVTEFSGRVLTLATVQGESNWPKEADWFMVDKDTLTNVIGASHDLHMQKIDAREDTLMTRARDWTENLITELQKEEIARNRRKVLEINHFLDIQKSELDNLLAMHIGPKLDPDVSAALG